MESTRTFVVLIAAALFACSGEDSGTDTTISSAAPEIAPDTEGPPESVYQLERRVRIQIELASSDWESLRFEGRSVANFDVPYEYNEYFGSVTIDGMRYDGVEIKKKGLIGSVSALRPSLRLDFKRADAPLDVGLRRLTLNGDVQDRSHVRQCMAFDLFERAGIPAPRCSFAQVIVNGKDLGTYTNVEPIREPMLRRHFADPDGNLYEGTLADFDDESWEKIEVKTNAKTNDRSDIQRLVAALKESDETVVDALAALIDLDAFRTFWAVETLIGHWDGYAESANNYYLYHDPGSDRFWFLPWGVDQAFTGRPDFATRPYDPTVYAGAALTRRLYALPEQRELFRVRLGELNDTLWDAQRLIAQSKTLAALAPDAEPAALAAHQEFLQTHGAVVREALAKPTTPPEALEGPPPIPPTCVGSRPLAADFESTWGKAGGSAVAELEVDGQPRSWTFFPSLRRAANNPKQAELTLYSPLDEGSGLVLALGMPAELVMQGQHPFHGAETVGVVGRAGADGSFLFMGFISDGFVRFDRASKVEGAPIEGRIEGVFHQTACLDPSAAE